MPSSKPAAASHDAAQNTEAVFPAVFGKYVLLRPMAKGGMGELFLSAAGEIGGFEKLCVVKKVLQDLDDDSVRRRFLDEAKVVVRLNHANLVAVFDAGRVGQDHYLAMELVEGKDLRMIWNRCAQMQRRIPVEFAMFVIREVCRGLNYVHDAMGLNLVHRDISPPNILVSYHGQVKITDFGLAKHSIKRELTLPGVVYGRYSYLAPEQARGQPADRRTDIYAAGVVLWEMLTGRQLFPVERRTVEGQALAALRNPKIVPPSELVPGIPDGLDRVILRALQPERAHRYQTAGEFRSELAEVLARYRATYDIDRVAEFMREIFSHERRMENQDYASYAREDFSRIRSGRPDTASYSVAGPLPEPPPGHEDAARGRPRAGPPPPRPSRVSGRGRAANPDPSGQGRWNEVDAGPRGEVSTTRRPASPSGHVRRAEGGEAAGFDPAAGRPVPQYAVGDSDTTPMEADFDDRLGPGQHEARGGHRSGSAPEAAARRDSNRGAPKARSQGRDGGWDSPEMAELEEAAAARIDLVIAGRYRLERLIGIGGMGAVYVAQHLALGKTYALKILHEIYGRDSDITARFMREARAATQTGHPNIIDVVDVGTTEAGDLFFVMELLDGIDVAQILTEHGRLGVRRVVKIARQVCRAVGAAHEVGIIHRDLKSENIMVINQVNDPDFVKVLDFGICKQQNGPSSAETSPGMVMGSPDYMAPEQAAGIAVDVQSDIYALGIVIFEMLTGKLPFEGRNAIDVLMKKGRSEAPRVSTIRPDVPDALDHVVARCLQRERSLRPVSMRVLEYELTRAVDGRASAVAAAMGMRPPQLSEEQSSGSQQTANDSMTSGDAASSSGMSHDLVTLHARADTARTSRGDAARDAMPVGNLRSTMRALIFVGLGVVLATAVVLAVVSNRLGNDAVDKVAGVRDEAGESAGGGDEASRAGLDDSTRAVKVLGTAGGRAALGVNAGAEGSKAGAAPGQGQGKGRAAVNAGDPQQPEAGRGQAEAAGDGAGADDEGDSDGLRSRQIADLVGRAEAAVEQGLWSNPPEKSLRIALTSLAALEPGHDAISRLKASAEAKLEPAGEQAVRSRVWLRALEIYRELVWIRPSNVEYRRQLVHAATARGRELLNKDRPEQALSIARELEDLSNAVVQSLELKADAHRRLGRTTEAIADYEKLLQLDPRHVEARERLEELR